MSVLFAAFISFLVIVDGSRIGCHNDPIYKKCVWKCDRETKAECTVGCQTAWEISRNQAAVAIGVKCSDVCKQVYPNKYTNCVTGCDIYEDEKRSVENVPEERPLDLEDPYSLLTNVMKRMQSMFHGDDDSGYVVRIVASNGIIPFSDVKEIKKTDKVVLRVPDVPVRRTTFEKFMDTAREWASDPVKVFFSVTLLVLIILSIIQLIIYCVRRDRNRGYQYTQLPSYTEAVEIKLPIDTAEMMKPTKQPIDA